MSGPLDLGSNRFFPRRQGKTDRQHQRAGSRDMGSLAMSQLFAFPFDGDDNGLACLSLPLISARRYGVQSSSRS